MAINYLTKENMYKIAEHCFVNMHLLDAVRDIDDCTIHFMEDLGSLSFINDLTDDIYVSIYHRVGYYISIAVYEYSNYSLRFEQFFRYEKYTALLAEIFSEPAEPEVPVELPFPEVCDTESTEQEEQQSDYGFEYLINLIDEGISCDFEDYPEYGCGVLRGNISFAYCSGRISDFEFNVLVEKLAKLEDALDVWS